MAGLLVIAFVLVVVGGAGEGDISSVGSIGGRRASPSSDRAVAPLLRSRIPSVMRFPGKAARLPFPAKGEAAVDIPGLGVVGESPDEVSRPIASLTKIMTAYLILRDHPLSGSKGGPVFRMTVADRKAWVVAESSDESNLEVKVGEKLDERQLLEALMIPSADNIAAYLAAWDAGSVPRFVARMNAEAKLLGMSATHYADASGLNPKSRSTALDQAVLAGTAMANPVLRSIVNNLFVTLPLAGRIWNVYNPAIHVDGIIGVKSGFTQAAQACLVTAAWRVVGRRRYLVVGASIGLPLGLGQAAHVDENLLKAVSKELSVQTVLPKDAVVATALASWDHHAVDATLSSGPVRLAGWPGLVLTPSIVPVLPRAASRARGWAAGVIVATLHLSTPASSQTICPVVLKQGLPPPPAGWTPPSAAH